uniref:Putative transcriptional activator n=1 Tax=Micrococcus sp. 28 TaxID=161213 RepID=Q8VPR4_9MICC|nr:putative transcriptional activator [Micrococcus sp. 28]
MDVHPPRLPHRARGRRAPGDGGRCARRCVPDTVARPGRVGRRPTRRPRGLTDDAGAARAAPAPRGRPSPHPREGCTHADDGPQRPPMLRGRRALHPRAAQAHRHHGPHSRPLVRLRRPARGHDHRGRAGGLLHSRREGPGGARTGRPGPRPRERPADQRRRDAALPPVAAERALAHLPGRRAAPGPARAAAPGAGGAEDTPRGAAHGRAVLSHPIPAPVNTGAGNTWNRRKNPGVRLAQSV